MTNHPDDGWFEQDERTLDPASFLRLLRLRWSWLVVALLLGLGVGYLLADSLAGNYTASVPLQPVVQSGEASSTELDAATEGVLFELDTPHFLEELRAVAGDGVERVVASAPETASIVVVSVIADTPEAAETGARGVDELLGRNRSAVDSSAQEAELNALRTRLERYDQRIAEITASLSEGGGTPAEVAINEGVLAEQIRRRADVIDQIDSINLGPVPSSAVFEAFALDAIAAEPAQPTTGVVMALSGIAFIILAGAGIFVSGLRGAGLAIPPLLRARLNLPVIDVENPFEVSTLAARITRQHYRSVGVVTLDRLTTQRSRPITDALAASMRASGSNVGVVDHDLRMRGDTREGRRGGPVGLAAYYLGRIEADHFVAESREGKAGSPKGSLLVPRGELDNGLIGDLDPNRTSDLIAAVHRVVEVCLVATADPNHVAEAAPVIAQLDAVLVLVGSKTRIRRVEDFLRKLAAAGVEPLAVGTMSRARRRPDTSHDIRAHEPRVRRRVSGDSISGS